MPVRGLIAWEEGGMGPVEAINGTGCERGVRAMKLESDGTQTSLVKFAVRVIFDYV